MLIKISDTIYINTDHITHIDHNDDGYTIHLTTGFSVSVSEQAGAYIIAFMEPNEGLYETDPANVPRLSLKSQLAVFLKEQVNGILLKDLRLHFPTVTFIGLHAAITELLKENVIRTEQLPGSTSSGDMIIYHRAAG